jgi:hypothetical protein
MEKIILIGIAAWLSFVLTGGFLPKPVDKQSNHKSGIQKQQTSKPESPTYKWIKTHYD